MQSGRNRAKCRPRAQGSTLRRRTGARTSSKGAARHSQATERGINVALGCRPALTGNEKGQKRRPRVSPGTHRRQKGAKTLPKGAGAALLGDEKGRERRPRAQGSTLRQRTEARTSPKGATRHSQATERGINVAQGCRPALTGDRKGQKRCPRAHGGTLRQRIGARTSP